MVRLNNTGGDVKPKRRKAMPSALLGKGALSDDGGILVRANEEWAKFIFAANPECSVSKFHCLREGFTPKGKEDCQAREHQAGKGPLHPQELDFGWVV